jgi:ribosomal protein S18 acetylase RimI-like enzyme
VTDAVRPASEADLPGIIGLNDETIAWHASLEPELFKPAFDPAATRAFFAGLLASEDNEIGVIGPPGALAGFVWFAHQRKAETLYTHAVFRLYIMDIAVAASVRGQGVGAQLMAWVEERARVLGASAVALGHAPANEGAGRFYERLGFATDRIYLAKPIRAPRA